MITDSIGCDEMATSEMRAQDFHPSCFREDAQNFVMFVVNIEKKTKKCSDESGRAVSSLNKFAAFGKSKLFFSPSFVLKLVLLVQGNRKKKKGKRKKSYAQWSTRIGEKASIGFLNGRIHAYHTPVSKNKEFILINCVISQSIALYTRIYVKHRITFQSGPSRIGRKSPRLSSHRNESDLSNCYRIRKRIEIFLGYDTTFFLYISLLNPTARERR